MINKKIVFVGGPRQVGKTTFAKQLLGKKNGYLNWDIPLDREKILKRELPSSDFWVFDEIHKYKSWRNYLKGLYDGKEDRQKILVTGSARLDLYRFGGDSLQGRYYYLRLFPLSFAELGMNNTEDLLHLLEIGGFPEPFFSSSKIEAKRWSREYRTRLIQDDIFTLERVIDLGNIELLSIRLPQLVGSPLSINSLREDLNLSHKTVAKWLDIFERVYSIFRIAPFGATKIRAVKKERKHYHFDWTLIENKAIRFENMIALHLHKWCAYKEDTEGDYYDLRYFRDVDKREVDFVMLKDDKPIKFIEVKWQDDEISNGLKYLKERFPKIEAYQISAIGNKDYKTVNGIRVCPAIELLKELI